MLQRLFKKSNQEGFTLIELLVVVAIIGILMAIGISNYLQYRTRGADQAELADAANFLTLALADVTANVGASYGDAATDILPPGFVPTPDIAFTGSVAFNNNGTLNGAPTIVFTHISGTAVDAIIADDGNGNAVVGDNGP